jgi:hypothetical protein
MPEIYEDEELAVFFASLQILEGRVFFELLLQAGPCEQEAM